MKEGWTNKDTGKKSEPRINFTHLQSLQDVLPDFAKKLTIQLPVEELKDQLMEFFPLTDTGLWRMWSSTAKILNHRDDDSLVDCPMAMRVKLYDENLTETLWLREDEEPWNIIRLPDLKDTNSFAWNNVRTYHGSEYDPQYKKILWILTLDNNLNVNKYIDLMDRSIDKYKNLVIADHRPREYYYDL